MCVTVSGGPYPDRMRSGDVFCNCPPRPLEASPKQPLTLKCLSSPEKQLVSQRHILHRISVRRRRGLQRRFDDEPVKTRPSARRQPCQWDGRNPGAQTTRGAVDMWQVEARVHQDSKEPGQHHSTRTWHPRDGVPGELLLWERARE